MLTGSAIKRIELPHEPGQWVDVQPLSVHALNQARAVLRVATATNGAELPNEDQLLAIAEPLLRSSIRAWSYPEPVTPEAIDSLDVETAIFVLTAMIPKPRSEEETKNSSSPITGA